MERDASQFVEIGLNQERYALPIRQIQEIIRMQAVTEVPNSKEEIQGVINLRGKIVPVVRLSQRLQMGSGETTASSRIVIVKSEESDVGLIVDRVYSVASFPEIQDSPEHLGKFEHESISGIGKSGEHLVCILNLNVILRQGGSQHE